MTNRRGFLRNTAVGAAAIAAGARWTHNLLASPYGMPVGIELFTVRDEMTKDARGTIKKLAEIGYKEVEIVHFGPSLTRSPSEIYGMPAKDFARLLSDNGMRAPSGHFTLDDVRNDWKESIAQARELGLEYMTNAGFKEEEVPASFDSWKRLVDMLNKAAEPVHQAGMTYNYHNHYFEFRKFGDTVVYDYLARNLDAKIHFTLDCYWVVRSGQDPVALIKAHPGRIPLLHIKDVPKGLTRAPAYASTKDDYVEVGRGAIDWKRIFAAAPVGGMKHFYYEHDECARPPLECAKTSFGYLNKLTV